MLGVGVTSQLPVFVGLLDRGGRAAPNPRARPAVCRTRPFAVIFEQPRLDAVPRLHFSRFPLVFPSAKGSGHK